MRIATIKVYKGSKNVTIDKTEKALAEWNEMGYFTSSQRKKMKEGNESEETEEETEINEDQTEETEDQEEVESES